MLGSDETARNFWHGWTQAALTDPVAPIAVQREICRLVASGRLVLESDYSLWKGLSAVPYNVDRIPAEAMSDRMLTREEIQQALDILSAHMDPQEAAFWLNLPNPDLGGRIPKFCTIAEIVACLVHAS